MELRIHLGPFSMRWLALHVDYEKNRLFVDDQIRGPFRRWVHRHQFSVEQGGTRLTDSVDFELPGGRIVELFLGPLAQNRLKRMFEYRHDVTRREAGSR